MLHFASFFMHRIFKVSRLSAIFIVALCAVSTGVRAQKVIENSADIKQIEQTERARIGAERLLATKTLAEQRAACYQKFAVTPCLNEARDVHREKTQDLKRQEVALNDARRKRVAADQLAAIEKRNSPQAQLGVAQRRGKALEATKKREESQAARQDQREAKQRERSAAAAATSSKISDAKDTVPAKPQPTGKPREVPPAKVKPELRPGQAEKMAKSQQQAAQREKAAEMRRAEAVQREAKRKKPPAAGLPRQD